MDELQYKTDEYRLLHVRLRFDCGVERKKELGPDGATDYRENQTRHVERVVLLIAQV